MRKRLADGYHHLGPEFSSGDTGTNDTVFGLEEVLEMATRRNRAEVRADAVHKHTKFEDCESFVGIEGSRRPDGQKQY